MMVQHFVVFPHRFRNISLHISQSGKFVDLSNLDACSTRLAVGTVYTMAVQGYVVDFGKNRCKIPFLRGGIQSLAQSINLFRRMEAGHDGGNAWTRQGVVQAHGFCKGGA